MNTEQPQQEKQEQQQEFGVQCHCGQVRGRFRCPKDQEQFQAWDCDCSDCAMRRNVHLVVPARDFQVDTSSLEESTTLYTWGTKTAQRRFCKTCGIMPWYRPRSNPNGYAITIYCVDWTQKGARSTPPDIVIHKFDGVHWEETVQAMKEGTYGANILDQST